MRKEVGTMTGKNVLITGGAAGIGKQVSVDLAAQGFRVAVADRDADSGKETVQHIRDHGGEAAFFPVDVSNWSDVERMVKDVLNEWGRVDVLVHSAAITSRIPFAELTWEKWQKTRAVNLDGLFFVVKAVIPQMKEQRKGNIVVIGSASAITGSGGGAHYAASKGGAFGFVRALARAFGPYGININVVAPRVIESEMLQRLYPDPNDLEMLKARIPVRRFGTPHDVSHAVQFLASDKASYIQGQILILDGGRTYSGQ